MCGKYGRCDTLAYGFVLGEKKAFLIQNMFPVTEEYFNNVYLDKNTFKPIQLSESLKKELKSKANKVLSLYKRKGIKLVFTDIEKILTKIDVWTNLYF
ncbi:type III toxin-antitoxin system CptIN family toxin [Thomasclavelia ramosa]|uniref:type III toxin-antitoxin system CptIN family toxin n=1 Tax=Thomasclavelia ramosa TaxID=1547 RepID=UPI003AB989AD